MNKLQTVYKIVKPTEDINTGITVKYIHNGMKFPVSELKRYVFTEEELKPLQDIADEGYDPYNTAQHLVVQRWLKTIENFLNK
jgi:hypothetical protein